MKEIIFFIALFVSWTVVSRYINSMALIIRSGQPRKDQSVSFIFELLACVLWSIFYILS